MIQIPKIKMKYFLMALPLIAVIVPMGFVSLERFTTSDQRFCLTCHYQMWGEDFQVQSQIHPSRVRCPECHATGWNPIIPPKDFSSDPERVNPNCLRCHEAIADRSDTEGFKYNVMKIKIPHRFHLDLVGAVCTDCHYNIKHDKHTPQTNRPRMVACFNCHDQETTSCLKCHPKGEHLLLSMLPRHEKVAAPICNRCHEGFETRTQDKYGIEFQHRGHLAEGLACAVCHENKVQHGMIVKSRSECLNCHHNVTDRDCAACHQRQVAVRAGTAVAGIEGAPDVMADFVDCGVCHAGIAEGHDPEAVRAACNGCHDETAVAKLDEIQREVEASLEEVSRLYNSLADTSAPDAVLVADILAAVRRDGSRGFHNAPYVKQLLKTADKKVTVLANAGPR